MKDKAAIEWTTSPEDLLSLPDRDHYEVVDGMLVRRDKSFLSSYVAGGIHSRLSNRCLKHKLGWVFPSGIAYQCFPHARGTVRKADVSFIRMERLTLEQASLPGNAHLAPDLVVEVVSRKDLYCEVEIRVEDWLAAGVQQVWVVNPLGGSVMIRCPEGSAKFLHKKGELTGENIVPGFRCQVRELFLLPTEAAPNT